MDIPQEQLRTVRLPIDPIPIDDPRLGEYGGMIIYESSAPWILNTTPMNGKWGDNGIWSDIDLWQDSR